MIKRSVALFLIFCFASLIYAQKLTVKVHNIKQITGNLMIGVFNNEVDFPNTYFKGVKIRVTNTAMVAVFTDLPKGKYAVSVYQDANMNGLLDKNIFGVPKEKYGFSNKSNNPDYKQSIFDFNDDLTLDIILK